MFAKTLLVGLLAAFAAAQGTSSTLSFTRVPNPITAGQPQALLYATSNTNEPVTILLRKGNPNDLQTVATLTTTATNGQYIWNPETSLENGIDYALEIKQGDQLNYYGPFQIQGGSQSSGSSSSSSSKSTATTTGSISLTHSGSISSAIATITASHNSTAITTATISSGTGVSIPRNTTMSYATLTRSSSASASTTASRTSNGAGFQGSQTSASAPANTGAASSLVVTGSSAVALAFGAVAAVFFW